jgi:hypothetical protein
MSMLKRVQRRPSTWLILLLVASMSTCVVVLLSAAPAPITWTPAAVTATSAAYQATLTDGLHRLDATIKDQAGNTAQATAQFTIAPSPRPPSTRCS